MVTEVDRINRLLRSQESQVRTAFADFISQVRSDSFLRRVRGLLENDDVTGALALLDSVVMDLSGVLPGVFEAVGVAETNRLKRELGAAGISLNFDPGNPRAAALMAQARLDFVTNFTEDQRAITQAALTGALDSGVGPLAAARVFRDSIGLNTPQLAAVESYRTALESGSADALDRAVRDRRFDRTISSAFENDVPLTDDQIDMMVGRYGDRMLALRADTIARTEVQRSLNEARQEGLQQSIDELGIDPSRITRIWRATQDDRTRDTHAAMDGQEVGLDEPFESPSGAELMFPGDPDAPPEETINCRCVIETVIN